MPNRNLICIVVDRLHAGMIGAYGNSWLGTAALDDLSSQSFVFDQAVVDCPQLESLYRSFWLGRHAADRRELSAGAGNLPQVLGVAGVHTALLTDEPEVARLPIARDFGEQRFVEPPEEVRTAADVSETCLGRLFGAASEWLRSAPEPFCLWIHARGMGGPWDAPLAMRNRFAEEDDPQPPTLVTVPDYWLADNADPDEGAGHSTCLRRAGFFVGPVSGRLLRSARRESPGGADATVRRFGSGLSTRFAPAHRPQRRGAVQRDCATGVDDALSRRAGPCRRSRALVQPPYLPGTLLDWLEIDGRRSAQATPAACWR